jgi:hypothetical protein
MVAHFASKYFTEIVSFHLAYTFVTELENIHRNLKICIDPQLGSCPNLTINEHTATVLACTEAIDSVTDSRRQQLSTYSNSILFSWSASLAAHMPISWAGQERRLQLLGQAGPGHLNLVLI